MGRVYETICQRRTIRRFQQKPLPEDLLERLVNGARLAPSGANLQPCAYIVVDEPGLVDDLFSCVRWAAYIAPAGDPPPGERPVAYIIVLVDLARKKTGGEVDAAAAVENILLAAWEEGVGTCWLKSVDRQRVGKILGIPELVTVDSVIAMGYPNEQPVVEEMQGSVEYWKDGEGILHVPKRRLKEMFHRNGYANRPDSKA